MAEIFKDLINSIREFEVDMDKDLSRLKYDDVLLKYCLLRKKFKTVYDMDIPTDSKSHDVITSKRHITKYYKNDAALEEIKQHGNITTYKPTTKNDDIDN